ncbi:hypothetical protein ACFL9T_08670 [Thermodesulfobacteriota bacterium]
MRRISNTPQIEAIDGNPDRIGTGDALMVDQGFTFYLTNEEVIANMTLLSRGGAVR